MKRRGLRRLLALALSVIMIGSTLTEVLPAALAAGNSGASSYADGETIPPTNDFTNTGDTGRPNLYVDFLGDNDKYTLWTGGYNPDGSLAYFASDPGTLMAPADEDQSANTNPVEGNRWKGYTENPSSTGKGNEVIFWVGVGLDRNDLQELWSEGGAYSLELGFYYNPEFIEPYVADGKTFAETLEAANIANTANPNGYPENTQWSENYEILLAEPALEPQTDEITQETTDLNDDGEDDMVEILGSQAGGDEWKMLYISLENTTPGSDARFENAYRTDAANEFRDPDLEYKEPGTEYIMLIPFVYNKYDIHTSYCLRLARNATHFSIGAGETTNTTGTEPYAAWERVTTRNPGKDIKLLTNFTGDLNIFTGEKKDGPLYDATLQIIDAGSTLNTAKLMATDDPSPNPAYVNTHGSTLYNLDDGTGMSVYIHCHTGFEFTVTVTTKGSQPQTITVTPSSGVGEGDYVCKFVMPASDVEVKVQFRPVNVTEFLLYLAEVTESGTGEEVAGNYTKVTRYYEDDTGALAQATMDSNTAVTLAHPDTDHGDGPSMIAKETETIQVDVTTHADYEAVVYVKQFSTDTGLTGLTVTDGDYEVGYESYTCGSCNRVYDRSDTNEVKVDPDTGLVTLDCSYAACPDSAPYDHAYHRIILPYGGTIQFTMVPRDLDIVVTYRKAQTSKAMLEVWHDPDGTGDVVYDFGKDVAQLVYPEYDVDNHASSAYSGVVYHNVYPDRQDPDDDNHSALAAEQDLLPWIHLSDATLSGALGGDHADDLPYKWWLPVTTDDTTKASVQSRNSIMALLAAATSANGFRSALLPRDLKQDGINGIYKNFQREYYAQSELGVFADYLWEMATRIENDPALSTQYLKTVDDASGVFLYEYFDLTVDQVQAYLVQCWTAAFGDEKNLRGYNGAKGYYDVAQAAYEEAVARYISPTAPVAPVAAPGWSVDADGVRSYADSTEYAKYIADYQAYIEDYQEYIEAVLTAGQDTPGGYAGYTPGDGSANQAPDYNTTYEPDIMKKVAVMTVTEAAKLVDESSGIWVPGTSGSDEFITTRSGREVWVVLEAESGWTLNPVNPVEVLDKDDNQITSVTVTRSSDYINVYTFEMPEMPEGEYCTVKVNYVRRETNKLTFEVNGADGKAGNVSELTAYGPQDATTPYRHNYTSDYNLDPDTEIIEAVYADGNIALKVGEEPGYQAKVSAQYKTIVAGTEIWVGYWGYNTVADGDVLTIHMPPDPADVKIVVDYKSSAEQYKATLVVDSASEDDNYGFWQTTGTTSYTEVWAYEGDSLTADVTIAPGYYIHSVTAVGETTGNVYPYVLSGNGYANGLNSNPIRPITVTVDVTMPGEHLKVTVNVRKGPPPAEGEFPLNLAVLDPDNDSTPYADNRAELEVMKADSSSVTIGPAGRQAAAMSAAGYANAGDVVRIYFDAADGYHVHSVTAAPANLSIPLEWVNAGTGTEPYVQFVMPAGSVGVTVEFKEGTAPTHKLLLAKTEDADPDILGNRATTVHSASLAKDMPNGYTIGTDHPLPVVPEPPLPIPTADSSATMTGVATAGELVTVDLAVAAGWYVHSVTVTDSAGNALPNQLLDAAGDSTNYITDTSTADDGAVQFTMPNGEANVVVHYREGDPPDVPEYAMVLTVADPDNVLAAVADNWAQATLTGSGTSATDKLGKGISATGAMTDLAYARAGDLVTIEYKADSGYALDIIVVTPSGLNIVPIYLGKTGDGTQRAQFTMPGENVQVLVKFKRGEATQYTANLVLRGPDDSVIELKVGGTFTLPTTGVLTNYPTDAVFSQTAAAGDTLNMDLFATDGYYIRDITVTPAYLGAEASLTGSFGSQQAWTVMPAGNITINVYFEKGWPDGKNYPVTLEVLDPAYVAGATNNSYAKLTAPLTSGEVYGGGVETVWSAADNDRVKVKIVPKAGYTYDGTTVTVVDRRGDPVDWSYAIVDDTTGATGITFTMPPNGVTVTVRFRAVTDADKPYNITLRTSGGGTATVTASGHAPITSDGDVISNVGALTLVSVDAEPNTDRYVKAAYAVTDSGRQLIVPMKQVTAGGTVKFAMPEENVTVHVIFSDAGDLPPADNDLPATLIVSGPAGSGSATMTKTDSNSIDVDAGEADMLFAKQGDELTVTIKAARDHLIKSVTVVDSQDRPVDYTWNSGSYDASGAWIHPLTLNMPAGGVTVHVVLERNEDPTKEYTAQVVVNDERYADPNTPSENNAWLREVGTTLQTKLLRAQAGETVELDVTVHPGYKIDFVVVTPRSHGIVPTLTQGFASDQTTSFVMPADDVVVYVKFVPDGLIRYSAVLRVEGPTGHPGNNATIHSNFSGTRGPTVSGGRAELVYAAPVTEWVTVDYVWDSGSSVESVIVKDDAGNSVPFTQVDPNKITLPMVERNITITVKYRDTPEPVGYDVVLHSIALDEGSVGELNLATITYAYRDDTSVHVLQQADAYAERGANTSAQPIETRTIQVPAGQTVDLNIKANVPDSYIKAAYVLYEDGGQMIRCNLVWDPATQTFKSEQNTSFVVHPGRNDVYVYYTNTKPTEPEYAAVLMLDGPNNNSGGATISGQTVAGDAVSATVTANGPHGYIIPKPGEPVTVTVKAEPGYVIDTVLVTPLGITGNDGQPLTVPMTMTNGVYSGTFDMPWENVAVYVRLKESVTKDYTATLHYIQEGTRATEDVENRADLYYTPAGASAPTLISDSLTTVGDPSMSVSQGSTVTLGAVLNPTLDGDENYILAAYVLRGTTLVPLAQPLEGRSSGPVKDNTTYDGVTTFIMPPDDVEVYLVVGDTPPAASWRTAILLVTDEDSSGNVNIGQNSSELMDDDKFAGGPSTPRTVEAETGDATAPAMGHKRMYVTVGQKMTLTVHPPESNYQFSYPATITHSVSGVNSDFGQAATTPNYQFTYTVGEYNSAVHVHYESALAATNPLTVEILDPDNPGNGTVTNIVTTEPTGLTPLTLNSVNHAGAYQIIPSVTAGEQVKLTVTPAQGYKAVAVYSYNGNTVELPLSPPSTTGGGTSYTSYFLMPGQPTTVTVKFYRPYNATLTVKDVGLSAADNNTTDMDGAESRFTMTEDDRGQSVTTQIDSGLVSPEVILNGLPHGTGLTVTPDAAVARDSIMGVIATTDRGSVYLTAANEDGDYCYSLDRSDTDIVVLLNNDSTSTDKLYIATVQTVGLPADTDAPTIASNRLNMANGNIWTMALENDDITVTVDVPDGYEARVTATDSNGGDVLTSTVVLAADGTVTFDMPAANVVVTVEYIKVRFKLTLEVVDTTTAKNSQTDLTAGSIGWTGVVTAFPQSADVAATTPIRLQADPADADTRIVAVMAATSAGTTYLSGVLGGDVSFDSDALTTTLTMPYDDMTLTVIYGDVPGTGPEAPKEPYIAATRKENDGGQIHNAITSIVDTTTSGMDNRSPHWTQAYEEDGVSVSFTTALGWYATVTAVKQSNGAPVTVIQQGNTGTGTAFITMPADDVLITVTYSQTPPTGAANLKLTLIKHDGQGSNNGEVYDLTADAVLLALAGSAQPDGSNVSTTYSGTVPVGDRLLVSGNWGESYRIEKITVVVDGVELELPRNSYVQNATALFYMSTGDTEVRIYFASIYTATLHIVGNTTGDITRMTDSRTGAATVNTDGGQLTELDGGETIMTTAIPDESANKRLVGVVRVTATTGAATVPNVTGTNEYDFTMPTEDVDVYVVYEPDSSDPSYIAKVAIDPDSEGYGVGGNQVTITNASDTSAAHGPFWTAAKGGDTVDVTVYLESGYQALITKVVKDDGNVPIYINRLIFIDSGTTGSFTMPVESDATVTIKYMKGYNLSLEVSDNSDSTGSKNNKAQILEHDGNRTITAISTGTTASVDYDSSADSNVNDKIRVIGGVEKDTLVTATAWPDTGVKTRIFYATYFDGTVNLVSPATTGSPTGDSFDMLAEDVLVSVLFQDASDPHDLIAKVALEGESYIVGNGYVSDGNEGVELSPEIIDTTAPAPATTIGQIWSTTQHNDKMKVTFTVAKGYMVEIQVRRDNPTDSTEDGTFIKASERTFWVDGTEENGSIDMVVAYYGIKGKNDTGNYDEHTFEFLMDDQDVTVILNYVKAASIPKPYDPTHAENQPLEAGWIYGENRGDHAVVTVPTLYLDKLYDADEYRPGDASTKVTFQFFIDLTPDDPDNDAYTELVVEGAGVVNPDIILEPYDVNTLVNAGDPYNYGNYYTYTDPTSGTTIPYTGAKFNLRLKETDPALQSPAAKALAKILDNKGTNDGTNNELPELFIRAQNAKGEISAYTQVVITPTYGLAVRFYSYAPTHAATVSLYRLMDETEVAAAHPGVTAADTENPDHYWPEPVARTEVVDKSGTGLWRQTALLRTANLVGDPTSSAFVDPTNSNYSATDHVYMLVIEKPSHITYTRVNIKLATAYHDKAYDDVKEIYAYNADTKLFTIRDDVILLAGDVDGNGSVKMQDRYTVNKWYSGRYEWSDAPTPADAGWSTSIYNPNYQAYWCDLDGDGRVTYLDYIIVNYTKHYGANAEWYKWDSGDEKRAILPWGMEELTASGTAPTSLEEEDGVYDLEEDAGIYDLEEDTGIYDLEEDTGIYDVEDGDSVYDLSGDTTLYPVTDGGAVNGTKEPAALPPSEEETDALLPEEKKDEEETGDPPEDATQ